MQNIWEHYEFTGNKDYLRDKIYPIMRESVRFYVQWLIYDEKQDRMVSSPTYSPEHGPATIGNTYEQSLIEQLFIDFLKASKELNTDPELAGKVKDILPKLKPYHIGRTGLLKEWFEEDEPDFDRSYSRSFYVGDAVTEQDISAKFENGTLKLTVPKKESLPEKQNKYIAIG